MKRTILMSLLVIGAVVALIVGASFAVFNDREVAPGAVAGGILELDLDQTQVVTADVMDLKPSVEKYLGPFWLHNSGTNNGALDLHFANVVDDGGELTGPEGKVEYAGPIDDISNWIDVDYWIDGPHSAIDDTVVCQSGAGLGRLADIESRTFDLGTTMEPSQWYAVCISFHLDRDAGNEYQGDVSTFDIEFTLHQTTQSAGRTSVRLENKDQADPLWPPILGDDMYGSVTYEVKGNGDLWVALEARGLQPGNYYQIGMTGPDTCSDTDDQLASGVQQYPNFDSHFWVSGAPSATCTTAGYGFYNFAYEQADAAGEINQTYTIGNAGVADPDGSTDVTGAHPALPSGVYTGVKFIVKYYEPNTKPPTWPGTFTGVLMEMETLNFNLP